MITYFDSSALVKKYVQESASQEVIELAKKADPAAISLVGYAEILSALYRKQRAGGITARDFRQLVDAFEEDWEAWAIVEVSPEVNVIVKRLLHDHPLRGFDAIHLASALLLKERSKADVGFVAYDERLTAPAKKCGLIILTGADNQS